MPRKLLSSKKGSWYDDSLRLLGWKHGVRAGAVKGRGAGWVNNLCLISNKPLLERRKGDEMFLFITFSCLYQTSSLAGERKNNMEMVIEVVIGIVTFSTRSVFVPYSKNKTKRKS